MYEVVTIRQLKEGQKAKLISLVDGHVSDIVLSTVGSTCFNYRLAGDTMVRAIFDLSRVVILTDKESILPANWPPKENDVWGLRAGPGILHAQYHMVNKKMRCSYGHEKTPEEFLRVYGYRKMENLVLILRDGKLVTKI